MAIKKVDGNLVWGPEGKNAAGASGLTGIIATSKQQKYSSEVEVIGADGETVDVVYTGAEETITETKYSTTFDHATVGSGTYATGLITRVSLQSTNEDMSKSEVEKIKKLT